MKLWRMVLTSSPCRRPQRLDRKSFAKITLCQDIVLSLDRDPNCVLFFFDALEKIYFSFSVTPYGVWALRRKLGEGLFLFMLTLQLISLSFHSSLERVAQPRANPTIFGFRSA